MPDPRFALISVSLDEKPAKAASFVKSARFSWRQGHAAPESPIVATYGATSVPATFLIGPDGKILAMDLRGEKLKAAVAAAFFAAGPTRNEHSMISRLPRESRERSDQPFFRTFSKNSTMGADRSIRADDGPGRA